MKFLPISFIIFWIIIIAYPEILAYLLGWFFIFMWINMLAFFWSFKKKDKSWDSYVKFWNYKIYR
jgi:hypothetical protein